MMNVLTARCLEHRAYLFLGPGFRFGAVWFACVLLVMSHQVRVCARQGWANHKSINPATKKIKAP